MPSSAAAAIGAAAIKAKMKGSRRLPAGIRIPRVISNM